MHASFFYTYAFVDDEIIIVKKMAAHNQLPSQMLKIIKSRDLMNYVTSTFWQNNVCYVGLLVEMFSLSSFLQLKTIKP